MSRESVSHTRTRSASPAATQADADSGGTSLKAPSLQLRASSPIQRGGETAEEARAQALDSARWAARLYEAMDGAGTDEDAIYNTLRPLSRDQVRQLKQTYQHVYSRSLVAHLRDELTNGEMRIALIYMLYWPTTDGILRGHPLARAQQRMLDLPDYSLNNYTDLLDMLDSRQRSWLHKGLAAGNSMLDLIPFAYRIRGKDEAWLNNHLRLTGNAGGTGIRQQWQMSCGPTTVQAVQGELDPVYALRIHDQNPNLSQVNPNNGTAVNPNMAADQQSMLQSTYSGSAHSSHAGVAAPVNNTNQALVRGRWVDDLLNGRGAGAGVRYSHHGYDATTTTFTDALTHIDNGLDRGLPVPIVIGSAAAPNAHYVLVTRRSGANYTIHDPGAGQSVTEARTALLNGTLSQFGTYNRIWAVEAPSPR